MACCFPGAENYQVFCLEHGPSVANKKDDAVARNRRTFVWVFEVVYYVYVAS